MARLSSLLSLAVALFVNVRFVFGTSCSGFYICPASSLNPRHGDFNFGSTWDYQGQMLTCTYYMAPGYYDGYCVYDAQTGVHYGGTLTGGCADSAHCVPCESARVTWTCPTNENIGPPERADTSEDTVAQSQFTCEYDIATCTYDSSTGMFIEGDSAPPYEYCCPGQATPNCPKTSTSEDHGSERVEVPKLISQLKSRIAAREAKKAKEAREDAKKAKVARQRRGGRSTL